MGLTRKIFLWLLVFGLAVVLDFVILRVWQKYKHLLEIQENTGVTTKRWVTIKQALAAAFSSTSRDHSLQGALIPRLQSGRLLGSRLFSQLRQTVLSWSVVNLVLAVLVLYAAQFYMVQIPTSRLWGLAALMGGIALAYFRYQMVDPSRLDWADVLQIGLGFLICLPLALNVDQWMLAASPQMQIVLWLLGILLVAVPAFKLDPQGLATGWHSVEATGKWEWGLLAALMLGAFLLRVIRLDSIPGPVDPDEASLGLFLMDVLEGKYTQPFGTGWATHPALQWFLLAPLSGLLQRPIFLMRLPAVIYGTLAVGALYLVARAGWGRRVAIIAGVLMMTSDVEIHFSRLGVNNISDSLFAAWIMAALWAAARTGNPVAYVLTGLGMGLGQYYYFGNRALPFVVFASLFIWAITNMRTFRRAWKHLVFLFLVFLIVAGPLLGLMIREPQTLDRIFRVATFFSKKWTQQAGNSGQPLGILRWQQVLDSLSVFTALPDRGTFYNPGRAMLPSLLAPLFFVGVFILAARWRRPPGLSLLAWILVVLTLGSILINTAATFQRLLGLYPAVILVTAIGLETGTRALSQKLSLKGVTPGRLLYAVVAVSAASNLFFYFSVFNTRVVWKPVDYEAVPIAVREYEQLDGQGTFILHTRMGVGEDGEMYRPLVKLAAGQDFLGSIPQMDLSTSPRPIYFYILHDKFDDLPNLQQAYPGGEAHRYWRRADWELLMIRYSLP